MKGNLMKTSLLLTTLLFVFVSGACVSRPTKRAATPIETAGPTGQPPETEVWQTPHPSSDGAVADVNDQVSAERLAPLRTKGGRAFSAQEAESAFHTEGYDHIRENRFYRAKDDPLSTFSVDVDTASYANVRRFLARQHRLPPKDAVRIEELLNYFSYDYAPPTGEHPFSVHVESTAAPWNEARRLVRIGIKALEIDPYERKPANLVFLLDVSGSMNDPNKLPLLKRGMRMLVEQLDEHDRVAVVVYAGASAAPSSPWPRT